MRIYHPWHNWECFKAGFFGTELPMGMEEKYALNLFKTFFLSDERFFLLGMKNVETNWPFSCQQWLTNPNINRIAWLGQAALCFETKIPAKYCSWFRQLPISEQKKANELAKEFLNEWTKKWDFETNRRVHRRLEIKRVSQRYSRFSSRRIDA